MSHKERSPVSVADGIIAVACGLGLALTLFAVAVLPFSRSLPGTRDFIIYWATGQQLVHHGNPWDPTAIARLEHGARFSSQIPYYMRNPPWALPLALPLGFIPARVAALPWALLMAAVLALSIRILWKITGRPRRPLDWLACCFPPSLICIAMGQTGLFLLLGLVLFLRLHRTRPWLAGASLWFCSLKPHLFLPWALVLLVWIVITRGYRILFGAAAALALSCLVTTGIDPSAWAEYLHWAQTSGISNEAMPCLGVVLRMLFAPTAKWLTFLPAILGCLWAIGYFWPRRRAWNWLEHGHLLVLVSILVAPYCWISDQCLAIPALIYAASRTTSRTLLAILGILCLAIELQLFAAPKFTSLWYFWPAPAWLIWYLVARASTPATDAAPALAASQSSSTNALPPSPSSSATAAPAP